MDSIQRTYKYVDKVITEIDKVQKWILIAILAETIVVGTMQVISRFVFHAPLPWSEELLRMSFIWVTFVGASLGMNYNTHINVDYFVSLFPKRLRFLLDIIAMVITLIFAIVCSYYAYNFTKTSWLSGQRSAAMEIPMAVSYISLFIGFGCMVPSSIKIILGMVIQFIKNNEENLIKEEHRNIPEC